MCSCFEFFFYDMYSYLDVARLHDSFFSDGWGQTGVYIAVDICIEQGLTENQVDVLGCVTNLGEQRPNMVKDKASH